MSSFVVLLTDAHEAPAYELIEALRVAGVKTLIDGLREVEVEALLARDGKAVAEPDARRPVAVLYEVVTGADMVELRVAIENARAFWPGSPLIACRRLVNGYQSLNLRNLTGDIKAVMGFGRSPINRRSCLPSCVRLRVMEPPLS